LPIAICFAYRSPAGLFYWYAFEDSQEGKAQYNTQNR
jgi:hypothetical protein